MEHQLNQPILVKCQTMEHQQNQRSYHQKKKKKKQRSDNRNQPIFLENIVLDILSRLPVKSLLRFRSVCRHWKSLISSPSFRKLHRQRHKSSLPMIIGLHSSDEYDNADWKPGKLFDYFLTTFDLYGKVVQQCTLPISSQSLNMMRTPSQSKLLCFFDTITSRCFLYNPITRHFFHLPSPPCLSLPEFKRIRSYSFGYILSKDEYKIVYIFKTKNKWNCEVLTMSIDNNYQLHYNAWRSIEITIMLTFVATHSAVFACEAFHWDAVDENGNHFILSFEFETEVFSAFEFPQTGEGHWGTQLLELKDWLYFVDVTTDKPPTLYLWKLSDVNSKLWTLKWSFNLQSLGYTKAPPPDVFDYKLFLNRVEFLQYYNEPGNISRELGKLKLEGDDDESIVLVEDEEDEACGERARRTWYGVAALTNLFTL